MTKPRLVASVFVLLTAVQLTVFSQLPKREVAVTFDDLPATHGDLAKHEYITRNLLAKLKAEKVPAIGFVNEQKLFVWGQNDRRTALLRQWLDDGHGLGNHTFSHVYIDQVPFEKYAEEVIRGETVTRTLLEARGAKLKYFRHPQLRTGPNEEYRQRLAHFLADRGYTVAPVTIDNNDFVFSEAYTYAKEKHDQTLQTQIEDAYIGYMEQIFEHFEKLSRDFLGREIKQTLLLHANEINADHFDRLAEVLRKRGYRFITLGEALKDAAYSLPEAQSTRGLSWIHRWMLAKDLPMHEEPLEPAWIRELSRSR
jgi:peptidoglycan/xylan/chitin deacetylase (PgdA/CDA1 family)